MAAKKPNPLRAKLKKTDTNRLKTDTGRLKKAEAAGPSSGGPSSGEKPSPITDPMKLRDTSAGKLKRVEPGESGTAQTASPAPGPAAGRPSETVRLKVVRDGGQKPGVDLSAATQSVEIPQPQVSDSPGATGKAADTIKVAPPKAGGGAKPSLQVQPPAVSPTDATKTSAENKPTAPTPPSGASAETSPARPTPEKATLKLRVEAQGKGTAQDSPTADKPSPAKSAADTQGASTPAQRAALRLRGAAKPTQRASSEGTVPETPAAATTEAAAPPAEAETQDGSAEDARAAGLKLRERKAGPTGAPSRVKAREESEALKALRPQSELGTFHVAVSLAVLAGAAAAVVLLALQVARHIPVL